MTELINEIAEIVQDAINKGGMCRGAADDAAAEVLAIPEIANALARFSDVLGDKSKRNLGHSIKVLPD